MVTMAIIAINVAVFLVLAVQDTASLTGGRITRGQLDIGLAEVFLTVDDQWYRLITSGFLHFGFIHIGFNMYLLYMLGQMLEPTLGRVKFGLVYFAGLLGGSAGTLLVDPNALSGGASGAVFGLMALAFVGYYLHGANPMNTSIGTLLLLNLFLTFVISDISIGGHIGGALAGAICGFAVMAPAHKRVPAWAGYVVPAAVCIVSIGAAVMIAA